MIIQNLKKIGVALLGVVISIFTILEILTFPTKNTPIKI